MTAPQAPACSVECYCGQVWTGCRTPQPQVIACAGCGRPLFVFPSDPWLPRIAATTVAAPPRLERRDWIRLTIAGLVTLGLIVGLSIAFLPSRPAVSPSPTPPDGDVAGWHRRFAEARTWLGQGQFRRAAVELSAIQSSWPAALGDADRAACRQLCAEAGLLADLLAEPLEDLLRHAASGSEEEWQAEFVVRYRGKTVLFDAEVRPIDEGWQLDYPLGQGAVSLEKLKLLGAIPDRSRQRVIFGARLESIRLEPPGPTWLIRFQPESGVFLTAPLAAAHACPPLGEADAQAILARQAMWIEK